MKVFYWDFFGPRAARTAAHFLEHLEQFLLQNACLGCSAGVVSAGDGHQAVFCRSAPEFETAIERTLRPKRALEQEA